MKRVREFLLQNDCNFSFRMNPPSASHMGGVRERRIRSVRGILDVILSQHETQLDDESLRTQNRRNFELSPFKCRAHK